MRSPTYGLYQAEGRAGVGMCADFQDPPALIGEFLHKWRSGAQVVLGQRRSERASPLLRAVRHAGYAFLNRFGRSEEHTSELQSLMRISYAVFCLKKKMYTSRQLRSNTTRLLRIL